jgi:hypothetical protein
VSATNTITATRARPITPDEACWLAADGSIWASVLDAKTGAMNEYVIDLPPCADSARPGRLQGPRHELAHAKSRGCRRASGGRLPGSVKLVLVLALAVSLTGLTLALLALRHAQRQIDRYELLWAATSKPAEQAARACQWWTQRAEDV